MAKSPAPRKERRIRVVTDPARVCFAAGAFWAGISEVPAESISAAQLLELKNHPKLEVSEVDVDVAAAEG
jgi:hypothetical protein